MRCLCIPITALGRNKAAGFRWLFALTFSLLLTGSSVLQAQLPLVREDAGITRIAHTWYQPAEGGSMMESNPVDWAEVAVHHGKGGRPELVVVEGQENVQRVNFRYDDNGDLVERIHRFPDSTEKRYTWKHRYDEEGRLLERTAYDAEGKLLSQEIKVYDSLGRTTDHAAFYRRYTDGESWTFQEPESGIKQHDANLHRMDSRHFYNDWMDRYYMTALAPFSLMPRSDAFQRYHYMYKGKNELPAKVMLYDQAGRLLEEDECYWDPEGRIRSINSVMPLDSMQWVWDFRYDDHGNVEQSRYVDALNQKNTVQLRTTYTMDGDRIASKTVKQMRATTMIYNYRKDGSLESAEERDLFNKLMVRTLYHENGRIKEVWRYNEKEDIDSVLSYSYE